MKLYVLILISTSGDLTKRSHTFVARRSVLHWECIARQKYINKILQTMHFFMWSFSFQALFYTTKKWQKTITELCHDDNFARENMIIIVRIRSYSLQFIENMDAQMRSALFACSLWIYSESKKKHVFLNTLCRNQNCKELYVCSRNIKVIKIPRILLLPAA